MEAVAAWAPHEIIASSSEPAAGVSCGDKISSCRRDVQVGNSHPQFKEPWRVPVFLPLWRQDFILSKGCASWKLAPTIQRALARSRLPSLVATRFYLVEGMCKLKTRTHNSKRPGAFPSSFPCGDKISSCLLSNQRFENSHPQKAWGRAQTAQAFLPRDSAEERLFDAVVGGQPPIRHFEREQVQCGDVDAAAVHPPAVWSFAERIPAARPRSLSLLRVLERVG